VCYQGKYPVELLSCLEDELRTIIGLLIYERVFESSHKNIELLYKMDGTGRLIFSAVYMLAQMCARYTV